jgi:hypothetical protein
LINVIAITPFQRRGADPRLRLRHANVTASRPSRRAPPIAGVVVGIFVRSPYADTIAAMANGE